MFQSFSLSVLLAVKSCKHQEISSWPSQKLSRLLVQSVVECNLCWNMPDEHWIHHHMVPVHWCVMFLLNTTATFEPDLAALGPTRVNNPVLSTESGSNHDWKCKLNIKVHTCCMSTAHYFPCSYKLSRLDCSMCSFHCMWQTTLTLKLSQLIMIPFLKYIKTNVLFLNFFHDLRQFASVPFGL